MVKWVKGEYGSKPIVTKPSPSLILDVGCGFKKRADVGVDKQRTFAVDVVCDAHWLPFKNECFDAVLSSHVLEHLDDPERALLEWCRVARQYLKIHVPWRNGFIFTRGKLNNTRESGLMFHQWSFNKGWFIKFGKKHYVNVQAKYFDTFIFPSELEVEIFKNGEKHG